MFLKQEEWGKDPNSQTRNNSSVVIKFQKEWWLPVCGWKWEGKLLFNEHRVSIL